MSCGVFFSSFYCFITQNWKEPPTSDFKMYYGVIVIFSLHSVCLIIIITHRPTYCTSSPPAYRHYVGVLCACTHHETRLHVRVFNRIFNNNVWCTIRHISTLRFSSPSFRMLKRQLMELKQLYSRKINNKDDK